MDRSPRGVGRSAHHLRVRRARIPAALRDAPFTTRAAAHHGVGRNALLGPTWRHVFRNVWVHNDLPDDRVVRLAAVRLILGEEAFVCGPTAAWLYGIDVQDRRSDLVWIGFPNGGRCRQRPGCFVREITVDETDIVCWDDVPLTTPVRTVFDCVRWLSPVEGVVVADALARGGLVTCDALARYTAEHRPLRHVRRVDRAMGLIEPLSESPMETRLRLLLVLAGLPRPVAQHVVHDASGRFVARLDLAYPRAKLAVEYDGAFHWSQRRADDRRRDALRGLGWTVLVVSSEDYYRTPDAVIAKIRSALAAEVDVHPEMSAR